MDVKTKMAVCVLPFVIAGGVGFALAYPAYNEYATKASAVEEKKTEAADLEGKLVNRNKVAKEKKDLDSTINQLRSSVPRRPDTELLNLDLEKMALESGLEMVAFKEADKDLKKRAGIPEEDTSADGTNMSKGKDKLAARVKNTVGAAGAAAAGAGAAVAGAAAGAAGAKAGAKPGAADAGKTPPPPDAGLLKAIMQVKLIGDYKSLMTFVHKLETYQRVVAISEVKTTIPKASKDSKKASELPDETEPNEDEAQGNPNQLNISLVLTAYYLP